MHWGLSKGKTVHILRMFIAAFLGLLPARHASKVHVEIIVIDIRNLRLRMCGELVTNMRSPQSMFAWLLV